MASCMAERDRGRERAREREGDLLGSCRTPQQKQQQKNHSPQLVRRETICCLTFSPQNVKFIFIMAPPACHHNYSCTTHDCVSLSDRLSLSVWLSACLSIWQSFPALDSHVISQIYDCFLTQLQLLKGLPSCFVLLFYFSVCLSFCSLYVY